MEHAFEIIAAVIAVLSIALNIYQHRKNIVLASQLQEQSQTFQQLESDRQRWRKFTDPFYDFLVSVQSPEVPDDNHKIDVQMYD